MLCIDHLNYTRYTAHNAIYLWTSSYYILGASLLSLGGIRAGGIDPNFLTSNCYQSDQPNCHHILDTTHDTVRYSPVHHIVLAS